MWLRKHVLDLRGQPVAAGGCGFDCFNEVFQHNVVHRLLKPQSRQPATMHLGSGGTTAMATLA